MKEELPKQPAMPYAQEPDYALRKLIGEDVDIRKVFSAEKVQAVQKIIDDARTEFFDEEKPRVLELKKLIQTGDPAQFAAIVAIAEDLKCQARIFGFSFISDLCKQIHTFVELESKPVKIRFQVLERIADALMIAMLQKMRDEGGILEKELNKIVAEVLGK